MRVAGAVVVVTGASSGIGRATALALAARGASLVVSARREEPLERLAAECERLGAPGAVAVPADVTDAEAVEALASRAVERFGRIDVWVANAGVYLVGRFAETPPDAFRRVLETNFFGCVESARAALPRFEEQGSGVLVFTGSIDAHVPAPWVSAYVASKWALLGFAESLRQELRDRDEIHVGVVSPAAIDTPLFQHAANYSGREVKAPTPTYAPEDVADAIVDLIERPRREVIVGAAGKLLARQRRLAPALADRAFAKQMDVDQFGGNGVPATAGNLFAPVAEGTGTRGGWQQVGSSARRLVASGAAAGLAAAGGALWLRRR